MFTRRRLALATGALSVLGLSGARAYTPGAGLEVAKYDRPGEGSVNSFLLLGPRSLVIVDCQRTAVEAAQVVAHARGTGLPVEAIFLSHEHADHVTGLEVVRRAFPEAPILAGEGTRDYIARNGAALISQMQGFFPGRVPDRLPVPTRVLRPDERITLAGAEWRVDQLGRGEASGMTLLYSEANDLLVTADLCGNRATPWLLDGHVLDWIAQLEAALPRYAGVGTALPGHGAAAPAGVLIREQLDYLRSMERAVRAELAVATPLTPEAARRIAAMMAARYPGFPRVAPMPNLVELNAAALAREITGG
ncbi:MBL fold metallo-hydrolase [Falsiroseomonas tokyonensis]|uniref:MBL fold metallo-hydrolase n=1 Tax=Falsiroseomonas tokyonensis TaxID=430521 RepID=A0ABV7C0G4_9PROT|nr:MBL fold metallo-hydrolase [Falsiroseomonas tokyonensis]MBU8541387.1 MBL fold metallo-hydrolase [Falsiroseomonas tokyonensis]